MELSGVMRGKRYSLGWVRQTHHSDTSRIAHLAFTSLHTLTGDKTFICDSDQLKLKTLLGEWYLFTSATRLQLEELSRLPQFRLHGVQRRMTASSTGTASCGGLANPPCQLTTLTQLNGTNASLFSECLSQPAGVHHEGDLGHFHHKELPHIHTLPCGPDVAQKQVGAADQASLTILPSFSDAHAEARRSVSLITLVRPCISGDEAPYDCQGGPTFAKACRGLSQSIASSPGSLEGGDGANAASTPRSRQPCHLGSALAIKENARTNPSMFSSIIGDCIGSRNLKASSEPGSLAPATSAGYCCHFAPSSHWGQHLQQETVNANKALQQLAFLPKVAPDYSNTGTPVSLRERCFSHSDSPRALPEKVKNDALQQPPEEFFLSPGALCHPKAENFKPVGNWQSIDLFNQRVHSRKVICEIPPHQLQRGQLLYSEDTTVQAPSEYGFVPPLTLKAEYHLERQQCELHPLLEGCSNNLGSCYPQSEQMDTS